MESSVSGISDDAHGRLVDFLGRLTGAVVHANVIGKRDVHFLIRTTRKRHLADRAAFRTHVVNQMRREFGVRHAQVFHRINRLSNSQRSGSTTQECGLTAARAGPSRRQRDVERPLKTNSTRHGTGEVTKNLKKIYWNLETAQLLHLSRTSELKEFYETVGTPTRLHGR